MFASGPLAEPGIGGRGVYGVCLCVCNSTVFLLFTLPPVVREQWSENTDVVCLGGRTWHVLTDLSQT